MDNLKKIFLFLSYFAVIILTQPANAQSNEAIVGDIRIQSLSENLIRIEQKGPKGFENRNTFTVVNRNWTGESIKIQEQGSQTIITTSKCKIELAKNFNSLEGIFVQLKNGKNQYRFKTIPALDFEPGPDTNDQIWILPDNPRLVPPEWGAAPPPENFKDDATSGWDTTNNAEDVYVFIIESGHYNSFRKDFLKLTGPTPMPPLFAFGLWNSRYYPYSEETALQTIDTYRKKQIPLDMFVVDTDWRLGASHGYTINDSLFPDMKRFIDRAHENACASYV